MFFYSLLFLFLPYTLSVVCQDLAPLTVDTSYYYRLTNDLTGPTKALDVLPDGSGGLAIVDLGPSSGQFWRLTQLTNGPKYALSTLYLGDALSLDVVNDDGNASTHVHLDTTRKDSGQYWTLTPAANGSFTLSNDFTGLDRPLGVSIEESKPVLGSNNYSGKHWRLAKISDVTGNDEIPALKHVVKGHLNEQGNYDDAHPSIPGTWKAVMVFVDFDDSHARDTDNQTAIGQQLMGNGSLAELFFNQSYSNLNLSIDVRSDLPWHTISGAWRRDWGNNISGYNAAAMSSFTTDEVDFFAYDVVMIVPPQNCGADRSYESGNVTVGSRNVSSVITVADDDYTNWYTMAHELGHSLGLPDLYPYNKTTTADRHLWQGGPWGLMADDYQSRGFVGWHRHRLGWLATERKTFVKAPTASGITKRTLLTPLDGHYGTSLLAMDIGNTSKLLVAEVVQPLQGANATEWNQGLMVYTIDSTVRSGYEPLRLVHNIAGVPSNRGAAWQTPWQVGSTMTYAAEHINVTLKVEQQIKDSYFVEVRYDVVLGFTGPTEFAVPVELIEDPNPDSGAHH
ncbi:uncharacterized protein BDZ99DRAFT_504410 [Mytilinidion resinicola]|uniref:M6 metalloprotease n=1 Tax=Mytilinidion resinicola TaxID=574789 RepID=A0A6A6XZ73_9PEZI|nr:uncharacterized protein BDZ99DRAFT_504410 [Mytilinidion resinicola]KAF2801710.1 hypothetical protein BDZ99DRAFT_504410 [Mytilinidion resinicola]